MPHDARRSKQSGKPGQAHIKYLKDHGLDPEELKEFNGKNDLFKDKGGNIYVKPKDGSGSGEPTGKNIKHLDD